MARMKAKILLAAAAIGIAAGAFALSSRPSAPEPDWAEFHALVEKALGA
jgi:hypothetical protein